MRRRARGRDSLGMTLGPRLSLFSAREVASRAEERLFGRLLLRALSDAFGRKIFEDGYFHGDPHPGNIMVRDGGARFALIDFGQVKAIDDALRLRLARVVVELAKADTWRDDDPDASLARGDCAEVRARARLVREAIVASRG